MEHRRPLIDYRTPQPKTARLWLGISAVTAAAGASFVYLWSLFNLSWLIQTDAAYELYGILLWSTRLLIAAGFFLGVASCASGSRRLGTTTLLIVGVYLLSLVVFRPV